MRKLFSVLAMFLFLMFFVSYAWAASGCTITTEVVDEYADVLGSHAILKLIVTQTGTTFSFDSTDFEDRDSDYWQGYAYWIGIDATGTLDAAPQLTVTDQWGFTQFSDTTSFHVSNPIKVRGNSYDSQYLHLTPTQTWSFNDVGETEVITIYVDIVR